MPTARKRRRLLEPAPSASATDSAMSTTIASVGLQGPNVHLSLTAETAETADVTLPAVFLRDAMGLFTTQQILPEVLLVCIVRRVG